MQRCSLRFGLLLLLLLLRAWQPKFAQARKEMLTAAASEQMAKKKSYYLRNSFSRPFCDQNVSNSIDKGGKWKQQCKRRVRTGSSKASGLRSDGHVVTDASVSIFPQNFLAQEFYQTFGHTFQLAIA